jgi:ankyrin repeat protein
LAAQSGSEDIVKLLIAKGADAANFVGDTPLMRAARGGHIENVKLLIRAGAAVLATNSYGETAIIMAARDGYVEIEQLLKGAARRKC